MNASGSYFQRVVEVFRRAWNSEMVWLAGQAGAGGTRGPRVTSQVDHQRCVGAVQRRMGADQRQASRTRGREATAQALNNLQRRNFPPLEVIPGHSARSRIGFRNKLKAGLQRSVCPSRIGPSLAFLLANFLCTPPRWVFALCNSDMGNCQRLICRAGSNRPSREIVGPLFLPDNPGYLADFWIF